jgi:ubiquinone biosynthesis protein
MATTLQRAYQNLRTGEAVFRDANRFRQILAVLIRHGFGALVQQLHLDDRWLLRKLLEVRQGEVERLPLERRILLATHDLGPTFVKLGQVLSTRADLLPPALIGELKTLQDAVPPMSIKDVRAIVRAELGGEVEAFFDDFDPRPLASASIAQVHRARIKDTDTEVVVKVQRPNLKPQIEADLEIMGFLARALEANFPEARLYSPAGIVEQFEKAIRREIDFSNEVDNIERFRRSFEERADIHVPLPYPALCTPRVLTMEFIAGTKITLMTPERFDVARVVRTALDGVVRMIFIDGFFHGDLHPGNLLVRDDNVLCLIDFGLCGRLTRRQRDALVDMMVGLVRQDFASVARVFWKVGVHGPDAPHDYDTFETDVVECLERQFAGKTIQQIEASGFFRDLVGLALKYRIRMPPDYTMTFKAIVTMEGVAKELAPDLDLLSALRPYVIELVAERYNPRRLAQSAYEALRELSDTAGGLPSTARAILEDLHAGRTRVNLELTRLEDLQRTYATVHRRNMLAVLAATAAVCGTLALDYREHTVLGWPALSVSFYTIAALLGGWFLRASWRHR